MVSVRKTPTGRETPMESMKAFRFDIEWRGETVVKTIYAEDEPAAWYEIRRLYDNSDFQILGLHA